MCLSTRICSLPFSISVLGDFMYRYHQIFHLGGDGAKCSGQTFVIRKRVYTILFRQQSLFKFTRMPLSSKQQKAEQARSNNVRCGPEKDFYLYVVM